MSIVEVNGRAWASFDGYLVDIDGTLLQCTDAVHYFAFCEALKKISGRELTLEGVTAHGNVDTGMLRDALALAGVPDEKWRPRLAQVHAGMVRYVEMHKGELCTTVMPAVHEVLQRLRARGAVLGVATGNLREIGRLKLQHAGLLDYFSVGGWSDGFEDRAAVFAAAVDLMREATRGDAAVCVVGDTPADVAAAKANDLPVIAVATGVYSRGQLEAAGPDLCAGSLAELLAG